MKKLIVLMLVQNFVIGQIQVPSEDGLDLFNNMMKYLFDNCQTEFGTIGFWGTDRVFLADDEVDFVLLNDSKVFKRSPVRRIKFLVAVFDKSFHLMPKVNPLNAKPMLEIETMFVFHKRGNIKNTKQNVFQWYQKLFQNSKVYYCSVKKGKVTIRTLNSFANIAPSLWTMETFNQSTGNVSKWRTFKTTYNKDTKFEFAGFKLCKSIFFDRTEKLNGHKIKATAKLKNHFEPTFKKLDRLITKDNDTHQLVSILFKKEIPFIKILTDYLNVTVEITHGKPIHTLQLNKTLLIKEGIIDLSFTPIIWGTLHATSYSMSHFYKSYPIEIFHDYIVTHNRGLATPLEKMFEFYGWLTIISTIAILLSVFIVAYLSNSGNNSRISFAVFECLRLLITNSLSTRMNTIKIRIFFFVIFLYFLIMQATFSGHLAAFLTKPVYRKNVETLDDLEDPRYTHIYANEVSEEYIKGTPLYKKTVFGNKCKDYINDTSIACIDRWNNLKNLILRHNLHTPKNFVRFSYAAFKMSPNWALRHRVNNAVIRLAQSGIFDFWKKNAKEKTKEKCKVIEYSIKNYHRPIELEDIIFAFYLLGIGLFSSIVCFITEYSIKMFTLNKTKILASLSKAKQFSIFIVRFFLLGFSLLFKRFYR